MSDTINFNSKFKLFSDLWSPKIIAEMNNYQFKLVKIKGEFIWHNHENTDEAFIVIKGSMEIEFKDRKIELNEGEMIVVKKNIDHKPFAKNECQVLLVEPKDTINTGNSGGELTSENNIWI
tara:strand:- start:56 stop:418 length:363 start_codon:yes stop_codon:yes gene_type:complete